MVDLPPGFRVIQQGGQVIGGAAPQVAGQPLRVVVNGPKSTQPSAMPTSLRPFNAGETRPNADGTHSTELTTTWQLPDGQWVNVPSLWMGADGPKEFDPSDEQSILGAMQQYESGGGSAFARFPDLQSAETAAKARSAAGGAASGVPALPAGFRVVSAPPANPYLADLPVPGSGPGYTPPGPAAADGGFNETPFAQGTSGVNEGIATVLGAPVDLTNAALRAGAAGVNALTGSDIQLPVDAIGGRKTIVDAMGPSIRPESDNPGNQIVRRIGQEVGASIVPGMGVIAKSTTPIRAAVGQLATATGAGAAAGTVAQVTDNPYAELAAQILGGGAVVGATQGIKKAITPFSTSPERQAMADTLAAEGVDLTPGQVTGSKTLRFAESELGGAKIADMTDTQMQQFTSAALSRAGISAERATPEVMARAYDDLGDQFDTLAARNTVTGDQQMVQDLGGAWSEYTSLVNQSDRAPVVESTIRDIANALQQNGGTITGEAYKSLRSRLGRTLKRATDPELSGALRGIQGALDDAMERSMQAANSPDLGAWQQVRSDYRNYMVLQNAAAGAGENAAMGLISPAMLRQAVSQQNKGAYVRGQGDFSELARAGVAMLSPLPNSGTAARMAVRGATSTVPAALGALAGNDVAGGVGALGGFALGSLAPQVIGSAMLSGPGRAYLTNRLLSGPTKAGEMVAGPALGGGINAALRLTALN